MSNTYTVQTEEGKIRCVTMLFDSEAHAEEAEVDLYDSCREKISAWLLKHFNEHLASDGEDIEASGAPADNEDVLDFRTTLPLPIM